MADLKVSFIQGPLVWHDPFKNRDYFAEKIDAASKSDLWLLPEMFSTGFTMQPALVSETMDGETVNWLKRLAITHHTHIGGSVVIEDNGDYYNRFLLADPLGNLVYYDKRHLFTMAGEHLVYSPGKHRVMVEINGWTINLQVCYDLRFPVFARNLKKQPYDLLIYVANWPIPRISAWDKLLMARSIENQCYTMGVNRIGTDANNMVYNGHSACIDPWGEVIAAAGEEEKVITVTLSKTGLIQFREKFPVLNDADLFSFGEG